jgi:hypothetical protein
MIPAGFGGGTAQPCSMLNSSPRNAGRVLGRFERRAGGGFAGRTPGGEVIGRRTGGVAAAPLPGEVG